MFAAQSGIRQPSSTVLSAACCLLNRDDVTVVSPTDARAPDAGTMAMGVCLRG